MLFQKVTKQTQKEEKQIRKGVYEIVDEALRETTAHGLPHIVKREYTFLKVLWTVCLLLSTSACGYMVYLTISDYFSYDTVTKVEIVQELPTLFPTVTICNENPYSTNYSAEFIRNLLIENGFPLQNKTIDQIFPDMFKNNLTVYKFFTGNNAIGSNLTDLQRKTFGFNLTDALLSCLYNFEPCSADDFEWYYDVFYGNCYRFNSGKNSKGQRIDDYISTKPGKRNGLTIELFVGEPKDIYSFSTTSGIHLHVHNKSIHPLFVYGLDAPTGAETNVAINRVFSSKIAYPYSDCIDNIESKGLLFVKLLLSQNVSYTQIECFNMCYQRYLVSRCNCHDTTTPYWKDDVKACLNLNDVICNTIQYSAFFSSDVNSMCAQDCPLECESITYQVSTSSLVYPTRVYAEYLKKNKAFQAKFPNASSQTYETIKDNILALNVYYESISYTHFSEIEKTGIIDVVANIGGTMGLFIGVSFLSIVEVFDVLIQIFVVFVNKNSKGKKSTVNNSKVAPTTIDNKF